MSSLLGTMSVVLQVSTVGTTKAMKDLRTIDRATQATMASTGISTRNINAAWQSVGRTLTQFVTLPLGLLEVVSAKTFSTFEYNLAKVTGLVGIFSEQTRAWGDEIVRTSSQVGRGTKELSDALYFVTTGGIRGVQTMETLATSAKLSRVGLGETAQIADILVSAMNAYGQANLSAAAAGDTLIRVVREGKAEASGLVNSLGVVFPVASQLGVSFGEVGAGMAAMTRTGTTAATSAMQLRRVLFTLVKPSQQAESALRLMGTSSKELRDSLREDGLLSVLMQLKDMMDTYGEDMIAKVFPNIRALAAVFDILGENLGENIKLFNEIADAGGDLDAVMTQMATTFKFNVEGTLAALSSSMTVFGESLAQVLIPYLEAATRTLNNFTAWFSSLDDGTRRLIVSFTLLVAALGPVIAIYAALRTAISSVSAALGINIAVQANFKTTLATTTLYTEKAAKGFTLMRNAIASIPLVWKVVAVALIVNEIVKLTKSLFDLSTAEKAHLKIKEATAQAYENEYAAMQSYIKIAGNEQLSRTMRNEALSKAIELAPEYLDGLTLENMQTSKSIVAVEAYTSALREKIRMQVLSSEYQKEIARRETELIKGHDKQTTSLQQMFHAVVALVAVLPLGSYAVHGLFPKMEAVSMENNAKRAKKYHEETMAALESEMAARQAVSENLTVQFNHTRKLMEVALTKEQQYNDAVQMGSEENIGALRKANVERQAVLTNTLNNVNKQIQAFELEKKSMDDVMKSDAILTKQKQIMTTAREKAEREAAYSVYSTRLKALQNEKKFYSDSLAELVKYKEQLQQLLGIGKTDIVDPDILKVFHDYDERMRVINRENELLGDDYSVIENRIKAMEKALTDYAATSGDVMDDRIQEMSELVRVMQDADKRQKQLTKTHDDFTERLRQINREQKLLGSDYDVIGEKIKNLETFLSGYAKTQEYVGGVSIREKQKELAYLKAIQKSMKENEDRTKKVTSLYDTLNERLTTINREQQLFGDSYDVLGEKIKAYERALSEYAATNETLDNKRINSWLDTLSLLKEAKQIQDDLNKLLEEQIKNNDKILLQEFEKYELIEKAKRALGAIGGDAEFAQTGIVPAQGLVGLEELKKILTELESAGLQFLSVYREINNIVAESESAQRVTDMFTSLNDELDKARLYSEKLGETYEHAQEKQRIWSNFLSKALRLNAEDLKNLSEVEWQNLIEKIEEATAAMKKYAEEQMVVQHVASGMADMISSIGTAMEDAEKGFQAMADSVISTAEQIINALLVKAFVAMLSAEAPKGLPGLITAAIGIAALKAMVSSARSDAKSASKLAQGGIVPQGYPNDTYPALLTSGEMVIPPHKLPDFAGIDREPMEVVLDGEFRVKGRDLYYVVKEQERINYNSY